MIDNFEHKALNWDNPMQVEMTSRFVSKVKDSIFCYKQDVVAEVGCGTGLVGLSFLDIVQKIYMIDNSPSMLNVLREKLKTNQQKDKVEIIENEFENTNLRDLSGVINFMSLHHIENISAYFDKVKESLKSNGFLVIGDLISEDGSFHSNTAVPHFGFDIEQLAKTLEQKGFTILKKTIYDKIEKNDRTYPVFIIIAQK